MAGFTVFGAVGSGSVPVEATLTLLGIPYELIEGVTWLDEAARMVFAGEIVNSVAVAGILAAHSMGDRSSLRSVEAPWTDRPHALAQRKAEK